MYKGTKGNMLFPWSSIMTDFGANNERKDPERICGSHRGNPSSISSQVQGMCEK
jgi:hypothetical protein